MPTNTARLSLTNPLGTDAPSFLRTSITANNAILDNSVLYTEGTFASRPAAGAVEHGHVYRATDTSVWYQSDGTTWLTVMLAGAWSALSLATNVSAAGGYTPGARREGDVVRLRGGLLTTGGGNVGPDLATLPVGFRPSATVPAHIVQTSTSFVLGATINTSGLLTMTISDTLPSGTNVWLDGITFTV